MFTSQPTVIGDAALLIGDDNLDTRLENRLLNQFLVFNTIFWIGSEDKEVRIACKSFDNLFDVLCKGRIAENIIFCRRRGLMPRHPSCLIV